MTLLESPGNFSRDASVPCPPRRFLSPADSIFARISRDPTGSPLNAPHDEHVKSLPIFPCLFESYLKILISDKNITFTRIYIFLPIFNFTCKLISRIRTSVLPLKK